MEIRPFIVFMPFSFFWWRDMTRMAIGKNITLHAATWPLRDHVMLNCYGHTFIVMARHTAMDIVAKACNAMVLTVGKPNNRAWTYITGMLPLIACVLCLSDISFFQCFIISS